MYRGSNLRFAKTAAEVPELTKAKVQRLTAEQKVDINSKIEILQTLAGYKWVGEAAHDRGDTQPLAPNEKQEAAIELLKDMGLAYRFDWLERKGAFYSWVQFAANKPMLDMFMDREQPFSVIEQGAVYGYPLSATLAFAGVVPRKLVREKSVAEYHLFGVNSEKYYEREVEYAEKVWRHLCDTAPELTAEAYKEYEEISKKITTSPQIPNGTQGDGRGAR